LFSAKALQILECFKPYPNPITGLFPALTLVVKLATRHQYRL